MGTIWFLQIPAGYLPQLIADVTSRPTVAKLLPFLIALTIFLWSAIAVVFGLLPNSAAHHLIVDRTGLNYRYLFSHQKIAWNGISEIALLALNGRWMLAVEGIPAPIAASDWARYRAAPLKLDLAQLLPLLASKEEAMTVVDWLNGLLKAADRGPMPSKTIVPSLLLKYVASGSAPMNTVPRHRKRPTVTR